MSASPKWLLALLTILVFSLAASSVFAEEATVKGYAEVGISGMDIDDNAARVDEYVKTSSDDSEINPAIDLGLDYSSQDVAADVEVDFKGSENFDLSIGADIKRMIRFNLDYQSFEHRKDHETLDQMGATARDDIDRSQPAVTTDKIMADLQDAGLDIYNFTGTTAYDATPDGGVGGGTFPVGFDPREAYELELSNDYIVTRRELESGVEFTAPALPNVVFHAGMRVETRQGMEQAIGLQKCDSCHVSATGKTIDERTEDFTFGATGKFGLFTVDYEYLNRTFSEDGATPIRFYEDASNPNAATQLLYENGEYPFARTPDSEKDTHMLKVRADLPRNTSITASYVKSEVESSKTETQDEYVLENDTLGTEYESFGGKLATKFGNLRLSLRANAYEIDADANEITIPERALAAYPGSETEELHSAEAREVTELGVDAVYRLSTATTVRLGYELETVDREEEDLNETKTHTFKASVKTRFNKQFSGRASYQYQNIDDPLPGAHVGIAQEAALATEDPLGSGLWYFDITDFNGGSTPGTAVWYWSDVYPNRTLESTSLPESVHEFKINTTWAPKTNMAATFFARVRMEENDDVNLKKENYVPGMTLWYAPNGKINLTMAYTFDKMKTENRMCVGWYHG